ncbi:SRPBCC family protein [Castellaniella sp. UC4442_H9]
MNEPAVTAYRLTTQWCFDAPLDVVWNAILDADGWAAWWPGVTSAPLVPGATHGPGSARRYTCRSVLPLRLIFVARITRVAPLRLIEGLVEGDLAGIGRCHFRHTGGQTTVRFDWQVHTTNPWLNRMGALVIPVLRWNHDRLMRNGGRGLGRYLPSPPHV